MSEEELKDKAKEAFKQGKSYDEIALDLGVSVSTLRKIRKGIREEDKAVKLAEGAVEVSPTLDFQDSPAPVEEKKGVEAALHSLKGMLGIKDVSTTTPKPLARAGVKLTAKQQSFVDATSPTLALGFISAATWVWTRLDDKYCVLAPDEQVALRIVTPLLRIYARHQTFLVDVNPDVADVGASVFALVAYIHVSYKLYVEIKRESQEDEEYRDRNGSYAPTATEGQSRYPSNRPTDVSRRDREHTPTTGLNGGTTQSVSGADIPTKEERQHAALLRLSEMDYMHRLRRTGRA